MSGKAPLEGDQYVLLQRWCSETDSWQDTTGRHLSIGAAENAAQARGIYRAVLVCGDRRLSMGPFSFLGSHPADALHGQIDHTL